MSASDKKKLRKEQVAAATTEKQRAEKKNQKKQTAYTVTFIVAMVLVLAIFVTSALQAPIRDLRINTSTAITVNDHKIGGAEFNYFYIDAISTFCNQFSSYGSYAPMFMQMYGFDPYSSLGSQIYNQETKQTWASYFSDSALESAKWTYAMYNEAMAKGFKLTEDQEKSITTFEESLKTAASKNNMSVNKYVQSFFGSTASLKSYMEYYRLTSIATLYSADYYNNLDFTDDQIREHEKDKYNEYSSYSYATYTVNVSEYLTGGTKETDEDGKTTTVYSDAEKQAALDAALADAKLLVENEKNSDLVEFNISIAGLKKKVTSCTENNQVLYSKVDKTNEEVQKWIVSNDRKEGELKYFENKTKTDGKETVSSYTVVLFLGRNDNTSYEGNVLHLLVKFPGGKTDSSTGVTTYTAAEKLAAKAEAEKLLAEYEAGEKTKEAFIELLKEHTDDVDSKGNANNGGLYEDITPASGLVQSFKDWAYDDHKPGDTGIIESEYGYHIMYYVEDGDETYRDILIKSDLANAAYEKWEEALVKGLSIVEGKPFVNGDYIVPSSYYSSSSTGTSSGTSHDGHDH